MGGAGREWSLLVVSLTLELVMGGREGPEVARFLERNLRGRV